MKKSAPWCVTMLGLVVLCLTVWNLFRTLAAFAWWAPLGEFAPRPGPLYIGATGILWSALGATLLWALELRKSWGARLLPASAALYTAWYWTDRLLLQTERANGPFALVVQLAVFALIFCATRTTYFTKERETDERESEDHGTA